MNERTFTDGDVIFREGDSSEFAYRIVGGKVKLTKGRGDGIVQLALLRAGEMFGEMGIIDEEPRSATAWAMGEVVLEVIPRQEFLNSLQTQPDLALEVMSKLTQRLRGADTLLAGKPAPAKAVSRSRKTKEKGKARRRDRPAADTEREKPREKPAPSPPPSRPGLLERLLGTARDRAQRPERIEIRIAALAGDEGAAASKALVAALEKRKGVRPRLLAKALEIDPYGDVDQQAGVAETTGRQWLAEADADLLVWGELPPPGTTLALRFVSLAPHTEDVPGQFRSSTTLSLPADFGPEFGALLYAAVLAALNPATEGKRRQWREVFAEAVEAVVPLAYNLPPDLTSREKAAIQVCCANMLALVAAQRGGAEHYQAAATLYKAALKALSRHDSPMDWALAHKNLGIMLLTMADRTGESSALEAAADAFQAALKVITRATAPYDWAALQNRLGYVLYRLDAKKRDTELLKQALSAFQAALQVYSRSTTPLPWAEVMNNFGLAAQVLGRELRNPDLMQRAVDACRAALEVRKRETSVHLWAASQNNLGSALFLLGKFSQSSPDLEEAATAFRLAHEAYTELGAQRMAAIAEKNMAHVESLMEKNRPLLRSSGTGPKAWFEDEGDDEDDGGTGDRDPGADRLT